MTASGSLGCTVWILQVTPGLNYGEWPHRIQHGSPYLVQARRPLPGSVPLARLLPAALWLGSRDSNGSSGGGGRGGRECLCGRKRRIAREVSKPPGSGGTLGLARRQRGGTGGDRPTARILASGEGTAIIGDGGGE